MKPGHTRHRRVSIYSKHKQLILSLEKKFLGVLTTSKKCKNLFFFSKSLHALGIGSYLFYLLKLCWNCKVSFNIFQTRFLMWKRKLMAISPSAWKVTVVISSSGLKTKTNHYTGFQWFLVSYKCTTLVEICTYKSLNNQIQQVCCYLLIQFQRSL